MANRDFYRMDHEIRERIAYLFSRGKGTKKHLDKIANGGKPDPEKIYMSSTADTYRSCLRRFAMAAAAAGYRSMGEAWAFIPVWLAQRAESKSAWTIRTDAAALAKFYGCMTSELGTTLPSRHQYDVTQHRRPETIVGRFSPANHPDLVGFCRACGLRRSEVEALAPEDVRQDPDGRVIVTVRQGKGGKRREVECLGSLPLTLAQKAQAEGRRHVFNWVPSEAPIHAYRAEYARAFYASRARPLSILKPKQLYRCRGAFYGYQFDKRAVKATTLQLGHNRLGVTVLAYLIA